MISSSRVPAEHVSQSSLGIQTGLSLWDPPWFNLLYSDYSAIMSLLRVQLLGYMFSSISSILCKRRRLVYIEGEGEVRIPIIMGEGPILLECSFNHFLKVELRGLSSLTTCNESFLRWLKENSTSNLLKKIPKKVAAGLTQGLSANWCGL